MPKTKISDLGSSICVDMNNEKFIPALGNGATGIPGDLCYIVPGTGKIALSDKTTAKFFSGILMESKITGTEAIIADLVPCRLVVPKSGHDYRIRCTIVAVADDEMGGGVHFDDDAGKGETTNVTLANSKLGRLSLHAAIGDTVAQITWIE